MEKIVLIIAALVLALLSYLALARPITIIKWMHAFRSLGGKSVITYEQSSMSELAAKDPQAYERKYPSQIGIVRAIGLLSLLMLIASICMLFN